MNPTLEPELIEAYALAKTDVVIINSIELRHPSISESMFFVQGFRHRELTVDGDVVQFTALPFSMILPETNDGGLQEMTITMDNVNNVVSDFCEIALNFSAPVEIYFRPYRSDDLTKCLMVPPLRLFLLDVQVSLTQVSGRAVPMNFLNMTFPNEDYTRAKFPGLSSF